MPQTVVVQADNTPSESHLPGCPHCETGTLEPRAIPDLNNGELERLWCCTNAPFCRYTAEDYDGRPLARHACACCGRVLKLIRCNDPFWACSGWFDRFNECRFAAPDCEGAPAT